MEWETQRAHRLSFAFEHTMLGLVLLDTHGCMLELNPAFCAMLGYPAEGLTGMDFRDIVHPSDVNLVEHAMNQMRAGSGHSRQMQVRCMGPDRTVIWVELSLSLARATLDEPGYFIAQVQDITERKEVEEQLVHRALHDPLTDLANRALFQDRMEHAISLSRRTGEPFAVLLVDLDSFKAVNDTLGHLAGDHVLRQVADRFRSHLRASDTLARFGGDEFVVVLSPSDVPAARTVADKLYDALESPIEVDGQLLGVQVSVGMALFPRDGEDMQALLRRADADMYAVKRRVHE